MGSGANFVIVENRDWRHFHSPYGGRNVVDALVGGPELALRYVRCLRPCGKDDWVSPMRADGGALIDLDRNRLLFFGDGLMAEMAERRALFTVLATMWNEYGVGWAYDGVAELAAYVGADRPGACRPRLTLAGGRKVPCHVVSVVSPGGELRMWTVPSYLSPAWQGPQLLGVAAHSGAVHLRLDVIPQGGVHIDTARSRLGVWQTAHTTGLSGAVAALWSGWQTECWEDRYEEQLSRCGGALNVPPLDLAAGIDSAQSWIGGPARGAAGGGPTPAEWARFTAACRALRSRYAASA